MVICISDSDDSDAFEWDADVEAEPSSAAALRNFGAPGPSTLDVNECVKGKASYDLVQEYVGMGFREEHVLKAIKEVGHNDEDELLNHLLTYKFLGDDCVGSCATSPCAPLGVEDGEDAGGREPNSDEDFLQEMVDKDEKIKSLQEMGFPGDEVDRAINICGVDASMDVLIDSIHASQHEATNMSFGGRKEEKIMEESKNKRKLYRGRVQGNQPRRRLDGSQENSMRLPNPMTGFSLPNDRHRLPPVNRSLPEEAKGRPFFYYENVAKAPKDTWSTISENLHGIKPEFVDSQNICATARKRGYVHNLPIENRLRLPLPPQTILETFPHYKQWWPKWDDRRKLNCLQTVKAPATVTEWIQHTLASSTSPPTASVQTQILNECRKWNLVWTGKNIAAPLEPAEIEQLLGFPINHTREVSMTDRYKSLGNSFQVDTVAYHLSVLKTMFPNGMTVLSLFTGIGGAEVALHRLGIRLKAVVSVEKSEVNRRIFRGWWGQTDQQGTLIEFDDVQSLSNDLIEYHTRRLGGFDLVIGGSPCNNLAGSNRHHRSGLQGKESCLFFHYRRILRVVKSVMATMCEEGAASY